MVIYEALKEFSKIIGVRDAQLIFCEVLNKTPLQLVLDKNQELTVDEEHKISQYINRVLQGEPLQYVIGSCEFMSLPFDVTPSVLIPRSDTETLVEYIIDNAVDSPKILDIGTGSGCIAISLAHYIPNSTVFAMDISEDALKVAKKNAKKNNTNIMFIHHDIMQPTNGSYDIIVSNPPYIETDIIPTLDTNVRDYEPHTALDGGKDGLRFYKRIINLSKNLLTKNGMLCFEVGHTQAGSVSQLMHDFEVKIIPDLCGIDRVVVGYKKF